MRHANLIHIVSFDRNYHQKVFSIKVSQWARGPIQKCLIMNSMAAWPTCLIIPSDSFLGLLRRPVPSTRPSAPCHSSGLPPSPYPPRPPSRYHPLHASIKTRTFHRGNLAQFDCRPTVFSLSDCG